MVADHDAAEMDRDGGVRGGDGRCAARPWPKGHGCFAAEGVRILGGCCGTTPAHIAALRTALDALPAFAQQSGVDAELTKFLLRVTGIALICELAAQLCRDAGSGGLAQKVELGGKVVILCACLPLVRELSACALSLLD